MATHSSILAWKIPWTVEPGGLQSVGLQRVRPNSDWACTRARKPLLLCPLGCSVRATLYLLLYQRKTSTKSSFQTWRTKMTLEEGSGLCFLRKSIMQLLGLVGGQCNFSFWLTSYMKFWNIRTLLILTGHKSCMLNKAQDLVTYKSLLTSCYCENLHQALKKKKKVCHWSSCLWTL